MAEVTFGLTGNFFDEGVAVQEAILTTARNEHYFGAMPSTYVHLRTTGFGWVAHGFAALLALALLWRVRDRPLMDQAFPVATATFIVLPYAFGYDMAVVSLGFAVMLHQCWRTMAAWEKLVAVLGFLSPTITYLPIAPLILLAGLHLQTRRLSFVATGDTFADGCAHQASSITRAMPKTYC